MKKSTIMASGLIAVIPLYCGATWITGIIARSRMETAMTHITDQAHGTIKIASRKSVNHFFTGSEDITFEIDNPVLKTLFKSATEDSAPTQFVIHNDIAYGPLPGFRSVGVARVETTLVLTDVQRTTLIEYIGTDKPFAFFTTFGYFGNSYFDVVSRKFDFHSKDSLETGTWKGGKLRFDVSQDLKDVSFTGSMPGLVVNGKNNSQLNVDDISLKGALQRKFEVLFTGNESFGIGNVSFNDPSDPKSSLSAKNLVYGVTIGADDHFINFKANFGSGAFATRNMVFKEMHFDFGMDHLDAVALASLYNAMEEWRMDQYKDKNADAAQNEADVKARAEHLKQDLLTLLQHSPVLNLNNVGFATADGILTTTGTATIDSVVAEDLSPDVRFDALAKKIQAQTDISIDQSLIDHWPIAESAESVRTSIKQFEAAGFISRKGATLQSRLEYKEGKLTANGNQIGG